MDFDDNVSLFAVYDGHGGAEVAQYAADKLPALVKNDLYKNGDYEKALIKAYLDFDDSLTDPTIVDALTALREAEEAEDCGRLNIWLKTIKNINWGTYMVIA